MRKLLLVTIISMMIPWLAACGNSSNTGNAENNQDPSGVTKQKVIGVSLYYRRDEFYKDLENGMMEAATKAGYKVIMQDADTDPKKQTEQIENFIAQKVDAIAVAVTDPEGMIPAIDAANKAGIPVFAFDGSTKDNAGIKSFIGMDNLDAGVKIGQWAKDYIEKNLGGKANVVIIDFPQSSIVVGNRVKGFKSALEGMPDVKIVAQQDGKASRTESMTVMENIIQANPKIDMVFGINDDSAFGAIAALEAAKRENVTVFSVGWSEELFKKLQSNDKYMKASAVQNPYNMGTTAIQTIQKFFDTNSVPAEVLDKSTVVTPDNIATFDWESIVAKRK